MRIGTKTHTAHLLTMLTICLLTAPGVMAGELTLTASVDRTRVGVNEQFVLTVSANGTGIDNLTQPALPVLEHFQVIGSNTSSSSQFSIVNGKVSSSKTIDFIYYLSPKQAGRWQIGAVQLQHKGKTYATQPIDIDVVAGSTQSQPQPASRLPRSQPQREVDVRENLFVKAIVDKREVFVGEQVTVTYKLLKRVGLSDINYQTVPSFTDFWVESLFEAKQLSFQAEVFNGIRYEVAVLKKLALFPTTDGTFTIEPLSLSCQVPVRGYDVFDSFFGRPAQVTIQTDPITVTALPLPSGAPAGFAGAVGEYDLSASMDKTQVDANQPVTLIVRITGKGNMKTLPEPLLPDLTDFKRYDSGSTVDISSGQDMLKGEKKYTYVLIPKSAGTYVIDPVSFSFFNPRVKSYRTVASSPLTLLATPGSAEEEKAFGVSRTEVEVVGKDIRYIKPNAVRLDNQGRSLYQNRWFQLAQLVPLAALAMAIVYRRHTDRLNRDVRYARLRRARRAAQNRLKEAEHLLEGGDPEKFHACIHRALTEYMGDKLNISSAGMTIDQMAAELEARGIAPEAKEQVIACLRECDFARFAPGSRSPETLRSLLDSSRRVMEMMEKEGL